LQLSPPGLHAPVEATQSLVAPSLAASHRPEQHSADAEQATPLALQIPVAPRQMPKSQRALQHSLADVQACPIAEQLADAPVIDAPMVDAPPGDWEETPIDVRIALPPPAASGDVPSVAASSAAIELVQLTIPRLKPNRLNPTSARLE